MDLLDIGLFRAAERRLAWVDARHRVLAQNIANVSTPGYQPQDVQPFSLLPTAATLAQTAPGHLPGSQAWPGTAQTAAGTRAPDGNAVSVEQQLAALADVSSTQQMVLNLHRAYQGMLRTAFGRGP